MSAYTMCMTLFISLLMFSVWLDLVRTTINVWFKRTKVAFESGFQSDHRNLSGIRPSITVQCSSVRLHLSPRSVRLYVSIYHRAVFVCTSLWVSMNCVLTVQWNVRLMQVLLTKIILSYWSLSVEMSTSSLDIKSLAGGSEGMQRRCSAVVCLL